MTASFRYVLIKAIINLFIVHLFLLYNRAALYASKKVCFSTFTYEKKEIVKNRNMIYALIVLLIIIIMPFKIVITKDDRRSDIDIYFTKIFNLRLDFDEFIAFLVTEKDNPDRISPERVVRNYHLFKRSKRIIISMAKMIRVSKLTFIVKTKGKSLETCVWLYVVSWIYLAYLQNNVHRYFKSVENEHYNQMPAEKFNLNFEFQCNFRLVYLIFAMIKNIKDLPKIIRFMKKGRKIYGTTSNS